MIHGEHTPATVQPPAGHYGIFRAFVAVVSFMNGVVSVSAPFEDFLFRHLPEHRIGFLYTRAILWIAVGVVASLMAIPAFHSKRFVVALWLLAQPIVFCTVLVHSCLWTRRPYDSTRLGPDSSASSFGFTANRSYGRVKLSHFGHSGYFISWGTMDAGERHRFDRNSGNTATQATVLEARACQLDGVGYLSTTCADSGFESSTRCYACATVDPVDGCQQHQFVAIERSGDALFFDGHGLTFVEWLARRRAASPHAWSP